MTRSGFTHRKAAKYNSRMTVKRRGSHAARIQELKPLSQLKIALFAAAVAERALGEARTLVESDDYPKAQPALLFLWDRLAANHLAYDAEVRARHQEVSDYIPRDAEEAEPLPQAWADAIGALSYAFMVLYKPENAHAYAANCAGEGTHLVATYYKDTLVMEEEEAKWQDLALALVQSKDAARAEFAALRDYARGDFEEPD